MGIFSGKGIPFFGYTIPWKKVAVPSIAGNAYKIHTWSGTFLEFAIPMHLAGTGFHLAKG